MKKLQAEQTLASQSDAARRRDPLQQSSSGPAGWVNKGLDPEDLVQHSNQAEIIEGYLVKAQARYAAMANTILPRIRRAMTPCPNT